jgi:hypothetical protein
VSDGVGSGSYSTGEDGDGETRPNLRGLRGGWPSSPQMADGGGSGGVRRGPELLDRRRWTGGIEGGGGGGENVARRCGREGRGEKRDRRRSTPFMAARWHGRGKGAGGPARCRVDGGNGKRRGGLGAAGDSVGGVAWPCRAVGQTGEGNRRLTGGLWPQCRVAALADRRARAA